MSVAEFYAQDRWGDLWGVTRVVNGRVTNPHRGHDVKAAGGETVPALRPGRVVLVSEASTSAILGYHIVVDSGSGFDYYCHLRVGTRPNVGAWVNAGDRVGLVAGWNDFHGSAWTGPHLHYGSGPNVRSVYEGTTYNATAIVRNALSSLAPAGDDIKEIIMATVQEIVAGLLKSKIVSRVTKQENEFEDFIAVTSEAAGDAAKHSENAAAQATAAKVAARANGDRLIEIQERLQGITNPTVTIDQATLEAAIGAALDARIDVIANRVAQQITIPTEGRITLS